MIFSVEGSNGVKRNFVKGFAQLLAKELKIDHHEHELIIYIKPNLRKEKGFAGVTGMPPDIPNFIGVGIDSKLNFDETMSTLAHEFVHVKQLLTGVLTVEQKNNIDVFTWKGKVVDVNEMFYVDRPWEFEAYSKQEVLVRRITGRLCGENQVTVS